MKDLLKLADLVMKFGEVERATRHPDGRKETDSTHTVMLAAFVDHVVDGENELRKETGLPPLNKLRALRYALYHDLPEAIAGDVVTMFKLTPQQKAEKDVREAAATNEIGQFAPRIRDAIFDYEERHHIEAHLVHMSDKLLPRLTHILGACRVPRELGMSRSALEERMFQQDVDLLSMCPEELPYTRELLRESRKLVWNAYPDVCKRWWISFYWDPVKDGGFHLLRPWYITDHVGSRQTVCAAVRADDEDGVRSLILEAFDEPPELEWRFIVEKPDDWTPFQGPYPRQEWMRWP